MSFVPAGAEDSDSEDDGFYMGSSYTSNSNHNKFGVRNGGDVNRSVSSSKGFTSMPAGAESDDEDSDGFEVNSKPFNSVSSSASQTYEKKPYKNLNKSIDVVNFSHPSSAVAVGRGQVQQRGRGRGGFPRPPASFSNRGKSARRFVLGHCILFYPFTLSPPPLRMESFFFLTLLLPDFYHPGGKVQILSGMTLSLNIMEYEELSFLLFGRLRILRIESGKSLSLSLNLQYIFFS